MTHNQKAVEALRARWGSAIQDVVEFRGETTVVVDRSSIAEVVRFLRDEPGMGFNFLAALTATDHLPEEPRFGVVYQMYSMENASMLGLKVLVPGDDPVMPTVEGVFLKANWHERELFDMFGIRFAGHSDMRRILMPEDWTGHPLRRDYPLGYEEVQFSFNYKDIDAKKPYAKE